MPNTENIQPKSVAFRLFYEIFLDHFINVDCQGILPNSFLKNSPGVWDQEGANGGFKALEIFGGVIEDQHYFRRKKYEANLARPRISICADAISKALFHIGCALHIDERPIHSVAEAAKRFKLFEEQHSAYISLIENDSESLRTNEIRPELVDRALKKFIPGIGNEITRKNRFQSLNGTFEGTQTQGQRNDFVQMTLVTGENNNVSGYFTVSFEKDELHEAHVDSFKLTALFFSDSILRCIYWNEDLSVIQHGYIDFKLSTDKNWLNGEFYGYYNAVPSSRTEQDTQPEDKPVGRISLKRINIIKTK